MSIYPVPRNIPIMKVTEEVEVIQKVTEKVEEEKTELWLNIETNKLVEGSTFLSEEIFIAMKEKYYCNWPDKTFNINTNDGEDGYLIDIFEQIRDKTNFCVDIGASNGTSMSNTKYISEQRDWTRLLFDIKGSGEVIKIEVTPDNVNELLKENDCPKEPDLISIDIDSTDYWIWKALQYSARVVIIEVNSHLPIDMPMTTPLNADHHLTPGAYYGVSILALYKLAISKEYSLVKTTGTNCIFVRDDLVTKLNWLNINNIEKLFIPADRSWL